MTLIECIEDGAAQLQAANVSFGHGTVNAFDEAAWLVLWKLGLPLDTDLSDNDIKNRLMADKDIEELAILVIARVTQRKPTAYLTNEAWLQGVPFYVDERVIVPRSLIAELLVDGSIDPWLNESTHKVLDLCTGNCSLAILAAMAFPDILVTASDLSIDALEVARINVDKHALAQRITLLRSDGLRSPELRARGPFDLILCNPPYVNAQSMAALPAEYQAEPAMALDGNVHGGSDGMDFIRDALQAAPRHMSENGVLVLEIGNERANFEAAFPKLETVWLQTSAGADQVLLLTCDMLRAAIQSQP